MIAVRTPTTRLCEFAAVSVHDERVRIDGELDALSAPLFTEYLNSLPTSPEVIDCSGVTFIGAAGITALVEAAQRHPFVTIGSPTVTRVCNICGVTDALRLLPDMPSHPG